jgi:hypothetical protein
MTIPKTTLHDNRENSGESAGGLTQMHLLYETPRLSPLIIDRSPILKGYSVGEFPRCNAGSTPTKTRFRLDLVLKVLKLIIRSKS